MITLKVTKKQGFTLSLQDTIFEKSQGEVKLTPSRFRVNYVIKTMRRTIFSKNSLQSLFSIFILGAFVLDNNIRY